MKETCVRRFGRQHEDATWKT